LDGSSRADSTEAVLASAVLASAVLASAGAALDAFSCGSSKVAGIGRIRHRLGGQMMTKARPITALSGIVPPPGSPS